MADRRKNQNYQALTHYLTESLWSSVKDEPRSKSQVKLFHHSWLLGLRCPSETTYCVMDNILRLAGSSECAQSASAFERYQEIGEMKKHWKRFKITQQQAGLDMNYTQCMEVLPRDVQELPAEYYLQAFQLETAEPTRFFHGCIFQYFLEVYLEWSLHLLTSSFLTQRYSN
jgi:hypothetical protein